MDFIMLALLGAGLAGAVAYIQVCLRLTGPVSSEVRKP